MKNESHFLDKYEKLFSLLPPSLTITKLAEDICRITPAMSDPLKKKLACVALTHGDEVIGLHIFIKLLEQIIDNELVLEGELILILANRGAYLQNQRYIESDLNRAYGENENSTLETARAKLIQGAIERSDYILDIHQCIEETLHPFFILPFSQEAHKWITAVAPEVPLIVKKNVEKATTLSSYGFLSGKKAVTFEVGDRGFDDKQLDFGVATLRSFLNFAWQDDRDSGPVKNNAPMYEVKHCEPYDGGEVHFAKAFKNFEDIAQGQHIATVDNNVITTPIAGKILLSPQKWFLKGSPIKAEGLFFVAQSTRV